MKRYLLLWVAAAVFSSSLLQAQTNILSTNPLAEQILLGNYDPSGYSAGAGADPADTISYGIHTRVSADSLKSYLLALRSFQNRNTGSDTVSNSKGIGAARRWSFQKLQEFSAQNQNRLIVSYLQFDQAVCSLNQHRNVFAVLPGIDTTDKSVVLIEAHLDSRCADLCDTACLAEGMEDNGSGSALVLELARLMSKYYFNHTLVFVLTIGEEQGLVGAEAFAAYAQAKGIKIKAVLNNDVIGGIICGHTSSAPGCPGLNHIDSTNVRLFSLGGFNSAHKQLSRYIKLQYKEMIAPFAAVPMGIHIMTPEDRAGRGGDHIPFRQHGFTAMRFTSANEHGDADVTVPGYADRQHTSTDVLGVDTNNDQVIDSFFVDFNYLARNTVINGNAAGMIAIAPRTPGFSATASGGNITVNITSQQQYAKYRLAIRTNTNDWDTVLSFTGISHSLVLPSGTYAISVASLAGNNVESLFSGEQGLSVTNSVDRLVTGKASVELLQNKPNPFDEATMIGILVHEESSYQSAYVVIRDAVSGKEVKRFPVKLQKGMNEVMYEHGYHAAGTFVYTLVIDGKVVQSRKMVFSN